MLIALRYFLKASVFVLLTIMDLGIARIALFPERGTEAAGARTAAVSALLIMLIALMFAIGPQVL